MNSYFRLFDRWFYHFYARYKMFKRDFKCYKSNNPPSSFEDALNLSVLDHANKNKVKSLTIKNFENNIFGLKPVDEWNVFEIIDKPGLIFISNPFTSLGQRYWITRSLKDYPKKPNKTNLDIHSILSENEDWWNYCQRKTNINILKKLRWATLGYHHNWDTKVYSDHMCDAFPTDLALLCNVFSSALDFKDFKAEAAIINYYHMDSTLSGHTDHSEQNLDAPLFSFSFGQTAIFLIGGETIEEKPIAIFLHSGDVIIMSKQARLCYHGVPKILYTNNAIWNIKCEKWNDQCKNVDHESLCICFNETLWSPFDDYLKSARININVRQVLNPGQLKLSYVEQS